MGGSTCTASSVSSLGVEHPGLLEAQWQVMASKGRPAKVTIRASHWSDHREGGLEVAVKQITNMGCSPPDAALPGTHQRLPTVKADKRMAVHFSSHTSEWPTPRWLFEALDREFGFSLDPCSTHANAKCARHFTREEDGLRQSWSQAVVFMNPPYGKEIAQWMAKAHVSASCEGATVVCLVPSRTDTAWWHQFAMKHEIRLLRGRLRFGDGKNCAPFPSAIIVMRPANFTLRAWPIKPAALGIGNSSDAEEPQLPQ